MKKLTKKEEWILNYLKCFKGRYVSPTEVGRQYCNGCHSSTASPVLLRLVSKGYVERNEKGHYKFIKE